MPKRRNKNSYQQKIAEYEKRKTRLKKQFDYSYRKKMPAIYYVRYKKMCSKIKKWKEAVRRHEKIDDFLSDVDQMVQDFLYCPPIKNSSRPGLRNGLPRKLFYTYVLENGRKGFGARAADYTGADINTPPHSRKTFRRSFKTHPENRLIWTNFIRYAEDR